MVDFVRSCFVLAVLSVQLQFLVMAGEGVTQVGGASLTLQQLGEEFAVVGEEWHSSSYSLVSIAGFAKWGHGMCNSHMTGCGMSHDRSGGSYGFIVKHTCD